VLNFFRVVPKSRKVRIKKSSGLIFSNPSKHRKMIFYIANMLFLGAIIYGGYLYTPLISAIYKYKFSKSEANIVPTIKITEEKNIKVIEEKTENKSTEYTIQIPKIFAYTQVIDNVSPFDKAEYDRVLKNNVVAQAKGTDKPGSGKGKLIYIFAHSTNNDLGMVRNNAVFYLLGELQKDDLIFLNFQGKEIKYQVFEKKIVLAQDLKYLDYHDENREVLILQTCWPIGTDWKRLLVLAEPVI